MITIRLLALALVGAVAVASWAATCAAWRADQVIAGVVPLDPRVFARMTLVTAGTGGAYENPNRRGPAIAIALGDHVALVDAGRSVAEALRATKLPVSQPGTVYLTSLLPENTVGLDDLLVSGWIAGRERPLRVVGPPGTRALVTAIERAQAGGIAARAAALGLSTAGARLEAVEIEDGATEGLGDIVVRTRSLESGPLAGRAYRFEAHERVVVVAPVAWAPETLVEFAQGADILVSEAAYIPEPEEAAQLGLDVDPEQLRREATLHTRLGDVGKLATRAGVKTLVLVRLRPPPVYDLQITGIIDDDFRGQIVLADDGDEITP